MLAQQYASTKPSFVRVRRLAESTNTSEVWVVRSTEDNKLYVSKSVPRSDRNGVSYSTMREVAFLTQLNHPNIVKLYAACPNGAHFDLILERVPMDLHRFLAECNARGGLPKRFIKPMIHQLLEATHYLHKHSIVHRDLKPANILVVPPEEASTPFPVLKVTDFDSARSFVSSDNITPEQVVTLWYRPPEVVLGGSYSNSVDMWSIACIFGELALGRPLFKTQRNCSTLLLHEIFRLLGTPCLEDWPALKDMPNLRQMMPVERVEGVNLGQLMEIEQLDPLGIDLLKKMLVMNPASRITTYDALQHRYFAQQG